MVKGSLYLVKKSLIIRLRSLIKLHASFIAQLRRLKQDGETIPKE